MSLDTWITTFRRGTSRRVAGFDDQARRKGRTFGPETVMSYAETIITAVLVALIVGNMVTLRALAKHVNIFSPISDSRDVLATTSASETLTSQMQT